MIERLKAAWRCLFRQPQFEAEDEGEDGWTDWIHPMPGYLLECCDCGLVHRMRFAIVDPQTVGVTLEPHMLNEGETPRRAVFFGAQRFAKDFTASSIDLTAD